jgi:hypothetical protein
METWLTVEEVVDVFRDGHCDWSERVNKLNALLNGKAERGELPVIDEMCKAHLRKETQLCEEIKRLRHLGMDGVDREEKLKAEIERLRYQISYLRKHSRDAADILDRKVSPATKGER